MSNRLLRVNELLQREISGYLRKRYTSEAARLTITGADITGDLSEAKIFYKVFDPAPAAVATTGRWLRARQAELRSVVARHVVLRQVPRLSFHHDDSGDRALRIETLLDELARKETAP